MNKLPEWEECKRKFKEGEQMTPIEFFIYNNEPQSDDDNPEETKNWRIQLLDVINEVLMLN